MEAVNQKKVVQIGDGFYNTAYFATALPDKTEIRMKEHDIIRYNETKKIYEKNNKELTI